MTIEVRAVDTVSQASSALSPSSKYCAGGTLLMRELNYGNHSFDRLVISNDATLTTVQAESDSIQIGASVTMRSILQHSELQFLADVARSVGGPALRNMATIGGNLFAPRPYGDMATALLALDAKVNWASGQQQSIDDCIAQPVSGDIVTSISIQKPMSGDFRYLKVSRVKPKGVSMLTIAVLLNRQSGRVGNARIAFGGMAPNPARANAAEAALTGASLDDAGIQRCVDVCNDGLSPEDDSLASAWYRLEVAPVYLKRLLLQRGEY